MGICMSNSHRLNVAVHAVIDTPNAIRCSIFWLGLVYQTTSYLSGLEVHKECKPDSEQKMFMVV